MVTLSPEGRTGSVTVVGAVSPPGGDTSEPVSQNTLRAVRVFWALDASLAARRHFPSINWLQSYSLYVGDLEPWYVAELAKEFVGMRQKALEILQKESELQEIVQLVGVDALPEREKATLDAARMLREDYLQQSAYDDVDTYTLDPEAAAYAPRDPQLLRPRAGCDRQGRDGRPAPEAVDPHEALAHEVDPRGRTGRPVRPARARDGRVSRLRRGRGRCVMAAKGASKADVSDTVPVDYRTIDRVTGPLLFVRDVANAAYGEIVEIALPNGERRQGQVLDSRKGLAIVQVFGATMGINVEQTSVKFMGEVATLAVSDELLGRVFNGLGEPRDGGPKIVSKTRLEIVGNAMNPYSREEPSEFIQTGISTIDLNNTLVRGQKLPLFSGAGLPHNLVAAQIVRQAKLRDSTEGFAVVFAAMGITSEESNFFLKEFEATGALERTVAFLNLSSDPSMERVVTPRMALTAAEFLAYERDLHVLVVLTDMTNYCEALREVSAAREEVPGRRGYPGYLYTDLATIYERAGKIHGRKGSITQLPILTMPADDVTHPIPDLTGYITEGQTYLSRDLQRKGIYPPIDILPSLSRLMNLGIGKGRTREDHRGVSDQLFAAYATGKDQRALSAIVGEEALSATDRLYLRAADRFEKEFVNQRPDEDRSIDESLALAWDILSDLPDSELKRIRPEYIQQYPGPSPGRRDVGTARPWLSKTSVRPVSSSSGRGGGSLSPAGASSSSS